MVFFKTFFVCFRLSYFFGAWTGSNDLWQHAENNSRLVFFFLGKWITHWLYPLLFANTHLHRNFFFLFVAFSSPKIIYNFFNLTFCWRLLLLLLLLLLWIVVAVAITFSKQLSWFRLSFTWVIIFSLPYFSSLNEIPLFKHHLLINKHYRLSFLTNTRYLLLII